MICSVQFLGKLEKENMETKLKLSKATVDYDSDANWFSFYKDDKAPKINISVWNMRKLIEAFTEVESEFGKMGSDETQNDKPFLQKVIQENARSSIRLELSRFNGACYVFLKSYYLPPRDIVGSAAGDEYNDDKKPPKETVTDERILAFESALKLRRESTQNQGWVPTRGNVQLCLEDFNPLMEFATYHVAAH